MLENKGICDPKISIFPGLQCLKIRQPLDKDLSQFRHHFTVAARVIGIALGFGAPAYPVDPGRHVIEPFIIIAKMGLEAVLARRQLLAGLDAPTRQVGAGLEGLFAFGGLVHRGSLRAAGANV